MQYPSDIRSVPSTELDIDLRVTQYSKKLTRFVLRLHGQVFLAQLAEVHGGLIAM
jgi:hypothetical protein